MLLHQDAASLLVAILNKKFRKRIFLGCDNHPLSRLGSLSLFKLSNGNLFLQYFYLNCRCWYKVLFWSVFFCKGILNRSYFCRQEMMDLVNGSGKFSKHFDKFNGKFMFLSETHISNWYCHYFNVSWVDLYGYR
jgi:hypothetical protein